MSMRAVLADRVEGRIAFLRAELAIRDDQQAQWAAFADALRAGARQLREARGAVRAQGATLLARLDDRQRILAARLEAIGAVRASLERLQAVLSDEQKATLEQLAVLHVGMT